MSPNANKLAKRQQCDTEKMPAAIQSIQLKQMGYLKAAKKFNVPVWMRICGRRIPKRHINEIPRMDFNQISTSENIRSEISDVRVDEASYLIEVNAGIDQTNKKEKADLPEKRSCVYELPIEMHSMLNLSHPNCKKDEDSDEGPEQLVKLASQTLTDGQIGDVPGNFFKLIENSESIFHGFEEILQGSSALLGSLGYLIQSYRNNFDNVIDGMQDTSIMVEQEVQTIYDSSDEDENDVNDNLGPLMSLAELQKASDLEKERIKQLQEQLQEMNESIRETDQFIDECRKINDELDEECRRLDIQTYDKLLGNETTEYQVEVTTIVQEEIIQKPQPSFEVGASKIGNDYQTVDMNAPNFDRWRMLYGDNEPTTQSMGSNAGRNYAQGDPNEVPFYDNSAYEGLESIWELGEEEE